MKEYRADLHVHSSFSNKPSIWALRKINCPESYSSPRFVYETAKQRGMDLVTITDHNTIAGALEIAHLPDAFISVEITASFPNPKKTKIHLVALDIDEDRFMACMQLRKNVLELASYLRETDTVHFIAHPIYDMNGTLTVDIIEQLLLLFDAFEVKNGSRAGKFNALFGRIIDSLTPEKMTMLAEKHGIAPSSDKPWLKSRVGGSDDHSGLFIARAHTVCTGGPSVKAFIQSIREGSSLAAGEDGDPLTLAHSVYGIGYRFLQEKLASRGTKPLSIVKQSLDRAFGGEPQMTPGDRFRSFLRKYARGIFPDKKKNGALEKIIEAEAALLLDDRSMWEGLRSSDADRKIFKVSSRLVNRVMYIFTQNLLNGLHFENLSNLFESISSLGMVHIFACPYYFAYHLQNGSKALINRIEIEFDLAGSREHRQKIALFTDTLHEINGVAITIKKIQMVAAARGIELTVITSSNDETEYRDGIMNFKSLGNFSLPEYPDLKMHFPPVLDLIDYIQNEGFTRIHVSTPGSLGIMGLLIGKLMDLPLSGTYHTDIPNYVLALTGDDGLENITWNYMIWFYNLMDEVTVPSASTLAQLLQRGLPEEKMKPLPRWVDTERFTPARRDESLWKSRGLNGSVKFLYAGRVSKEKGLELLKDAFLRLTADNVNADLIITGDGPYREEMQRALDGCPVLFTGYLTGDDLVRHYASADVFVFPSATDTFGNVVLEAQACGLPVIVSDQGGARELLQKDVTGIVFPANDLAALIRTMAEFASNRSSAAAMGAKAREFTLTNRPHEADIYHTLLSGPSERIPKRDITG